MSGEKTEKATPKKLRDLRKKGMAARSFELPQGVALMVMVLVLPGMVTRLMSALRTDLTLVLANADVSSLEQARTMAGKVAMDASRALAPGIAIVGIAALVSGMVVTRSRPNPAMLKPRLGAPP